jgi:abhydrolase domain-containing protein 17
VILLGVFTSIYRVLFNLRFTLFGDKFDNINKINKINCPILLIHGTLDEIVPFSHSKEVILFKEIYFMNKKFINFIKFIK